MGSCYAINKRSGRLWMQWWAGRYGHGSGHGSWHGGISIRLGGAVHATSCVRAPPRLLPGGAVKITRDTLICIIVQYLLISYNNKGVFRFISDNMTRRWR